MATYYYHDASIAINAEDLKGIKISFQDLLIILNKLDLISPNENLEAVKFIYFNENDWVINLLLKVDKDDNVKRSRSILEKTRHARVRETHIEPARKLIVFDNDARLDIQVDSTNNRTKMIFNPGPKIARVLDLEITGDLVHHGDMGVYLNILESAGKNPTSWVFADPAMKPTEQKLSNRASYGGIDLNAAHLNLQIKRDGQGVPLPINQQDLENIKIEGLIPVIISIKPATSVSIFPELENTIQSMN